MRRNCFSFRPVLTRAGALGSFTNRNKENGCGEGRPKAAVSAIVCGSDRELMIASNELRTWSAMPLVLGGVRPRATQSTVGTVEVHT